MAVPRPSMVDREGNITALFYFHDRPLAAGSMTQEVVLEVCQDEGLQQVIWVSQSFPEAEVASRYGAIYREGVERYGLPQDDPRPDTVVWPGGRTLLALRSVSGDQKRLIMISTGDRYERCSDAHVAATGHRASLHTTSLLDPAGPAPR
ncbi:threonyl-trna synthetase [Methylobacterium durans]|nr:threonyl-trna synthetase [Methylobacterium durans]